jgi:hypothetical protein
MSDKKYYWYLVKGFTLIFGGETYMDALFAKGAEFGSVIGPMTREEAVREYDKAGGWKPNIPRKRRNL